MTKKSKFSEMSNPMTNNPAEQFISVPTTESPTAPKKKVGRPKSQRETKQNVTITLYPSVYEDIKKLAQINGTSASSLIGEICEEFIANNKEDIRQFEKIFGARWGNK